MDIKDELKIELAKNEADKFIIKKELEREKNKFIEELKNGVGNEIIEFRNINNAPIKIKKPFYFKLSKIWNNIKKVMGY